MRKITSTFLLFSSLCFLSFVFCLLPSVSFAQTNEQITITTYYPSPYGVYSNLRLFPGNAPACDNTQRGLLYYDNTSNEVQVCRGGALGWGDMGGGVCPSGYADVVIGQASICLKNGASISIAVECEGGNTCTASARNNSGTLQVRAQGPSCDSGWNNGRATSCRDMWWQDIDATATTRGVEMNGPAGSFGEAFW